MSTSQYLLNAALLAFVLGTNLGTRRLTRRRLALPLLLVGVVGLGFLQHVPTLGNDVTLEAVGALAGVVLGVLAGLLVRVGRDASGSVVTRAGAWYAALWVAVVGGRVVFAHGAGHWFGRAIGTFSMEHRITGADAWTVAFVLMALAMVVARVAVTGVRAHGLSAARRTAAVAA